MATFDDFKRTLAGFIKVNSSDLLDPNCDYDIALETARNRFSKYRTKQLTAEYTGTGEREYALPDSWDSGVSENGYFVEFPIADADNNPFSIPRYLEAPMSQIYHDTTGDKLRFTATYAADPLPQTGEKFRLHYEASYSLNKNATDIPSSDVTAVCYLAASVLCKMLAVRYSTTASTLLDGSAQVDYQNKGNNFLKLSDSFMDDFKSEMFGHNEGTTADVAWGDFEESFYDRRQYPFYPRDTAGRSLTDV